MYFFKIHKTWLLAKEKISDRSIIVQITTENLFIFLLINYIIKQKRDGLSDDQVA